MPSLRIRKNREELNSLSFAVEQEDFSADFSPLCNADEILLLRKGENSLALTLGDTELLYKHLHQVLCTDPNL